MINASSEIRWTQQSTFFAYPISDDARREASIKSERTLTSANIEKTMLEAEDLTLDGHE